MSIGVTYERKGDYRSKLKGVVYLMSRILGCFDAGVAGYLLFVRPLVGCVGGIHFVLHDAAVELSYALCCRGCKILEGSTP